MTLIFVPRPVSKLLEVLGVLFCRPFVGLDLMEICPLCFLASVLFWPNVTASVTSCKNV